MAVCENCRKREATLACLLCRRSLCNQCFDAHILPLTDDMDEGFAGATEEEVVNDQPVVCEVCGQRVESKDKDDHLFEAHGITI